MFHAGLVDLPLEHAPEPGKEGFRLVGVLALGAAVADGVVDHDPMEVDLEIAIGRVLIRDDGGTAPDIVLNMIPDVFGVLRGYDVGERPVRPYSFRVDLAQGQDAYLRHGGFTVAIGPVNSLVGRSPVWIEVCPVRLDLAGHGRLVIPGLEKRAPQLVVEGEGGLVLDSDVAPQLQGGYALGPVRQQEDRYQDGPKRQISGMQPGAAGHGIGVAAVLAPPLPPSLAEIVVHAAALGAIRCPARLGPAQVAKGLEHLVLVPQGDLRDREAAGFGRQQEVLLVRVVFRGHYGQYKAYFLTFVKYCEMLARYIVKCRTSLGNRLKYR